MAKEELLEFEGEVTEELPDGNFRVKLDNEHVILAYTDDFARHSRYLSKYPAKVRVIPPPVEMPIPTPEAVRAFREQFHLEGAGPFIGMASRLAAEKGVAVEVVTLMPGFATLRKRSASRAAIRRFAARSRP